MLRILLVAPGLGLQTTAEVRDLTTLHRVTVLSDIVTRRDVYQAAGGGYDVIHFSSHSNDERVSLSGNECLTDTDLLQVARIAGAKLVFFNSCYAGRLAHYLMGHGVALAIHTNQELQDADAWTFPAAFYGAVARLGNGRASAYVRAFSEANDGGGLYGLAIAPDVARAWASAAEVVGAPTVPPPPERPALTRLQWGIMAFAAIVVGWLLILSVWPMLR